MQVTTTIYLLSYTQVSEKRKSLKFPRKSRLTNKGSGNSKIEKISEIIVISIIVSYVESGNYQIFRSTETYRKNVSLFENPNRAAALCMAPINTSVLIDQILK